MLYLYLKIHKVTGLKYLGKTSAKNPHTYKGSGKYWQRHISKHGYDVDTIILFATLDSEELKAKGLYYSELWDVVNSNEFANLKPESGDGGWEHLTDEQIQKRYARVRKEGGTFRGKHHTDESRSKIKKARAAQVMSPKTEEAIKKAADANRGRKRTEEQKRVMSEARRGIPSKKKDIPLTEEHKANLSKAQRNRYKTHSGTRNGTQHTEESKQKIREARAKQVNVRKPGEYSHSEETRRKMSESRKDRVVSPCTKAKIGDALRGIPKEVICCPHCGKVGGASAMKRWHFDNCKQKENKSYESNN